jgi:hypothetical protein
VIYIGIDDTDVIGSPGTNQLARRIVRRLGRVAKGAIICRHQLFFDPRVPFTTGNGSASIQLPHGDEMPHDALIAAVRQEMLAFFVEGSDPGLAVASTATDDMKAFAARAKTELVRQLDARSAVERSECHLEGLGGTNQGIIGAVAAIAFAAGGDDGRVVHLDEWPWPDTMSGVQPVSAVRDRGIAAIRSVAEEEFTGDEIDVGKHLRPNWRGGRVVLFVERPPEAGSPWRALKLDGRE